MTLTSQRPTDLLLDDPVFRRYWFPVARFDALADGPIERSLLGEELVIWSPATGIVSAAINRCPHRDARLSTGWLEPCGLVCPYHGWAFGEDGAPTRIPQLGDASNYPPKAHLTTFRAAERYGWVWVALDDEPLLPIPEIAEFGADGWRVVSEPESDWDCTANHLIDNNIDPAHIAYVHRESFGTPARPEVEVPQIEHNATGMQLRYQVAVESRPGESTPTVRNTVNQLHGPFLMLNRITYPDGVVHLMVKACTPATTTTTHQLQMVLRNDTEAERPAADIIAFDDQVWAEDRGVLEHCWTDFRIDLTGNVHLRTDKASIEYRRWLGRLVTGDVGPANGPGSDGDGDADGSGRVSTSRHLAERSAPDIAEAVNERSIVILPFGAIEQHGPHLPMATDLFVVEAYARAVVAEFGERLDLWMLPALPYTNSNEHIWAPGTMSFTPETMLAATRDLGRSLARMPARRVVLLNGHGGNTSLLDVVCRELRVAHGLLTFLLHPSLPADHGGTGHPDEQGLGIHGGITETSVVMHLRPDLVQMERAVSNVPLWLNDQRHIRFGGAGFGWLSNDFGPSGVIGDATGASADFGKLLFEESVSYLGEALAEVAEFEFPDGPESRAEAAR